MTGFWIVSSVIIILVILAFVKANLKICHPNEILIFSGRKRRLKDGTEAGYRIIKGGRGLKIPVLESVTSLSLNAIPIDLALTGALTNGVIPIDIQAMATVKIAGSEGEGLSNALERFLGKNTEEISRVAKENLEGSLRGVLATLTPEETNSNRLEFAERVARETRSDFMRLGLVLDTFKIKSISDGQGYLEAGGRKKSAEVMRDARITEANAEAEARQVIAEAKKKASMAEALANTAIAESENKLRVKRAELDAVANTAESRAKVAGEISRISEEKNLEKERVEMNRSKYEAEMIVPARAEKEAKELRAIGDAARIAEEGKATAEAVRSLKEQWEKDTRDLFLIQQLPDLLDKITGMVADNLRIDKISIIDSGNGKGMPGFVKGVTGSVAPILEGIKDVTGLDIPKVLGGNKEY